MLLLLLLLLLQWALMKRVFLFAHFPYECGYLCVCVCVSR
jgi:hypothetical protein